MAINCDIFIIVAMTKTHVIGNNNTIPWHISDDLKTFKHLTSGNTVVMGRKTYESIGKPLPNRHNIIISNSLATVSGAEICSSFENGIRRARELGKRIFCIGGEEIYRSAIEVADYMYISWINQDFDGDTKFPNFDICNWDLIEKKKFDEFSLSFYQKIDLKKSSNDRSEPY